MITGRVLLIEDDASIARVVQRGLALKGIEVFVAEDGSTGRDAWMAGSFELVLLDVMLPGIDGIDLCAERRAAGDSTPVILLTARDADEVWDRGRAAGATAYIGKPFAYAHLTEQVLRLLRRDELG
jgi:two-component system alkaline phosphatase synthesis response regulator PhoP